MSGTNGPVWLTTIRKETVAGQDCDIVTFDFVDTGATLSINLTLKEVLVNWAQIVTSSNGASKQLFVQDKNPDGSVPRWKSV